MHFSVFFVFFTLFFSEFFAFAKIKLLFFWTSFLQKESKCSLDVNFFTLHWKNSRSFNDELRRYWSTFGRNVHDDDDDVFFSGEQISWGEKWRQFIWVLFPCRWKRWLTACPLITIIFGDICEKRPHRNLHLLGFFFSPSLRLKLLTLFFQQIKSSQE